MSLEVYKKWGREKFMACELVCSFAWCCYVTRERLYILALFVYEV